MIYTNANRGKIFYPDRKRQLIDFSTLRFGNITPTDIDAMFERLNRYFAYYEYKYRDAIMPYGQELAETRQVDTDELAGKKGVLFVCRHNVSNPNIPIDAGNCLVDKFYTHGEWWNGDGRTAYEYTKDFFNS